MILEELTTLKENFKEWKWAIDIFSRDERSSHLNLCFSLHFGPSTSKEHFVVMRVIYYRISVTSAALDTIREIFISNGNDLQDKTREKRKLKCYDIPILLKCRITDSGVWKPFMLSVGSCFMARDVVARVWQQNTDAILYENK